MPSALRTAYRVPRTGSIYQASSHRFTSCSPDHTSKIHDPPSHTLLAPALTIHTQPSILPSPFDTASHSTAQHTTSPRCGTPPHYSCPLMPVSYLTTKLDHTTTSIADVSLLPRLAANRLPPSYSFIDFARIDSSIRWHLPNMPFLPACLYILSPPVCVHCYYSCSCSSACFNATNPSSHFLICQHTILPRCPFPRSFDTHTPSHSLPSVSTPTILASLAALL